MKTIPHAFFCSLLLLGGFLQPIMAQTNSVPETHRLGTLPMSGVFTKKFTYHQAPAAPANLTNDQLAAANTLAKLTSGPADQVLEQDTTTDGQVRLDVLHTANGSKREQWRWNIFYFEIYPDYPDYVAATAHTRHGGGNPDFEELGWITDQTFSGVEARDGKKYDVHRLQDKTAWLDQETHLPLYFESAEMTVVYSYGPPPDFPLQIPDKIQKRINEIKRSWGGNPNPSN